MINETIQWAVLVVLCLLVLGLFRQISLGVPVPATAHGASGPPVGAKLPERVSRRLRDAFDSMPPKEIVAAFVQEGCPACQRLLSHLEDVGTHPGVVLVARASTTGFKEAVEELGRAVVWDEEGEIWQAVEISAVPLVLRLDERGTILAKEVTHRVDRVAQAA